jgi:hypothetical protein
LRPVLPRRKSFGIFDDFNLFDVVFGAS